MKIFRLQSGDTYIEGHPKTYAQGELSGDVTAGVVTITDVLGNTPVQTSRTRLMNEAGNTFPDDASAQAYLDSVFVVSGDIASVFSVDFGENGSISTVTNSGRHWAIGNGEELTGTLGWQAHVDLTIIGVSGTSNTGTFDIEVEIDGLGVGTDLTIGSTNPHTVSYQVNKGQYIRPRTKAVVGGATVGVVSFFVSTFNAPEANTALGELSNVDTAGAVSGDTLVFDGTNWIPQVVSGGGGSTDVATVNAIAAGNTIGLQQQLLAADGQTGKTVLAVAYSYYQGETEGGANHKAQITSLEDGNIVFVYSTGADFNNKNPQEGPIFLSKGEIYVIQNIRPGSIITATQGAYGYSQQRNGNDESPMPLLSYALAFEETFLYAFRNSQNYRTGSAEGWVHVVNGPIASEVTFTNGSGAVIQGQKDIALEPWEYLRLYTQGNQEYILSATNPIMAAINAEMDDATPRFYDSRLVLPLAVDSITWPRSGRWSSLYNNTTIKYYANDGQEGSFTNGPGNPFNIGGISGMNDADYEPRGATRFLGLGSAYSGADSSGLEATPACDTETFTQRIAIPLRVENSGDGGNNGIALASKYTGTARLYQWNQSTGVADLVTVRDPVTGNNVTEMKLIRRDGGGNEFTAATPEDQLHPASCSLSAAGGPGGTDPGAYDMLGDFSGGYIEVTVPAMCVFNSNQNENGATTDTFRGTSGASVLGINADDDEQLSYGITPPTIRAEVTTDTAGMLRKRVINNTGTEIWELA